LEHPRHEEYHVQNPGTEFQVGAQARHQVVRERRARALRRSIARRFLAIEIAKRIEPSGSGPRFEKLRELAAMVLVENAAALETVLQAELARG
jgi:hypothetical protein